MIIGIDASKSAESKKTGVENFVYQLVLHLSKVDHKNTYFLFSDKHLPEELLNANFKEIFVPFPRFWNKLRLPLALLKHKPDIYLQPAHTIPLFAPEKTIAVCHDLAWAKFPDAYSPKNLFVQKMALKNIVKKAKSIVCTSKSTKKDLDQYAPEAKSKTSVIYIGGNSELAPVISTDPLKIRSKYFLSVGRLEERKNTKNIILAFEKAKGKGLPHKLVLTGKPGYGYEEIKSTMANSEFARDIIAPGYVEEKKMNDILGNADALVYPSLYEGFGLSALEAMQAGVPVITSNSSSLPEVVGDSALLVDPENTDEIAEALVRVATDKKLRDSLIKKGQARAKKFNWLQTAEDYLKLMEEM